MAENTLVPIHSLRQRLDSASLLIVRGSVLVSLVYATWHYGAVESSALLRLSIAVGIGLVASLGARDLWGRRGLGIPTVFAALMFAWIAYAGLQVSPAEGPLKIWFSRSHQNAAQFLSDNAELAIASARLSPTLQNTTDEVEAAIAKARDVWGTAIPEDTMQAMVPYAISLGLAMLAAIGFRTLRSRRVLLIVIIANAVAMSAWGIIQRAGGGLEILPGILNDATGHPFGSFIYKNAGAAAILPALASLLALKMITDRGGRATNQWQTVARFAILFAGGILISGLVASLSRGAWFALLIGGAVVAPVVGISIRDRRSWFVVAGLAALMLAIAMTTGITDDISKRAGQIDGELMSQDQRWGEWADGFQTALAHLPSGSGLGTYGYASLPFQSEPRGYWFRDAHNQFLEVFTETGLIGISILVSGIVWFSLVSIGLVRQSRAASSRRNSGHRELLAWGVVGIAIICFGVVQSSFDFVLKIPANMMLYAILISVIATVATPTHQSRMPIGPVLLSLILVCVSFSLASRNRFGDEAIAATSIARLNEAGETGSISDDDIRASLATLDEAIRRQPLRSGLHLQRALVDLTNYRLELVKAAESQGVHLGYRDSRIASVHALVMSRQPADREAILADFIGSEELRQPLARAVADLGHASQLNPYQPHPHLRLALIAPIVGLPTDRFLAASAKLANNSQDLLFDNGLIAFYQGDTETMLDQWSKSIAVNHDWLQPALDMAVQRVSVSRVVERLVPANRPDRIMEMLRKDRDADVDEILEFVKSTDRFNPAQRDATLASLYEMIGKMDDAIDHWKKATTGRLKDPNFRLSLALALQKANRIDEAIDQAVLGQRLFPDDDRFDQIARSARKRL